MVMQNLRLERGLTLFAARKLIDIGLGYARDRNARLSIAVVDVSGNLLAFARMDGAAVVTIAVAQGKAQTAALIKAESKVLEDMINGATPSIAAIPGLVPLQGGVPVYFEGDLIGAVGVCGAAADGDQHFAQRIAAAFAVP